MTTARTIDIPGVGPVLFRRNRRARRIVVSVSPRRGVRATVPAHGSYKAAAAAVLTHKEWISKTLGRIERDRKDRQALEDRLKEIGPDAAGEMLASRLSGLAGRHGFTCNRISIRSQATRWGSCSSRDSISLNVKLVCLPDELRDYVLLHELVHTRVRNHSPEFHAELEKYVPDARLLSRRLRRFGLLLL